jgi:hypothetical protein
MGRQIQYDLKPAYDGAKNEFTLPLQVVPCRVVSLFVSGTFGPTASVFFIKYTWANLQVIYQYQVSILSSTFNVAAAPNLPIAANSVLSSNNYTAPLPRDLIINPQVVLTFGFIVAATTTFSASVMVEEEDE